MPENKPAHHHLAWIPTLLAVIAGLLLLERWPLWEAELFTVDTARGPLGGVIDGVIHDRHPPLHFLVVHAMLALGERDGLLRLPSALAGGLAVWGTTRFALARLGPIGLIAGIWMVSTPVFLLYLGVARMYAMLPCWSAALLLLGWGVGRGGRPVLAAAALSATIAGALYTHYIMLLPALAAGSSAVLSSLGAAHRRRLRAALGAGATALGGLAFLPWAAGPMRRQEGGQVRQGFDPDVLLSLLWPVDQRVFASAWIWLGLAVVGLVVLCRRLPAVILPWALFGLGGALALSGNPDLVTRQYVHVGMLPAFALCVAAGLGALAPRLQHGPAGLLAATGLVLAVQAAPMAELARLPSLPLGAVVDGSASGTWDARREASLLGAAMTGDELLAGEGGAAFTLYERAGLAREVRRGPVGDLADAALAWTASHPEGDRTLRALSPPQEGCSPSFAFMPPLSLPSADACARLEAALTEHLRVDPHGPFLLEASAFAWHAGEVGEALLLADRAAEAMVDGSLADLWRARLMHALGREDEALEALEAAEAAARVHGDPGTWLDVHRLRAQIPTHSGPSEGAQTSRTILACMDEERALYEAEGCGFTPDRLTW